jgi:hypothetical protein
MAKKETKKDYMPGGVTGKGFKPGQSGNPKGRPKGRTISNELRKIIEEDDDGKIATALAKKALQCALDGDFRYWNAIIERVDGKIALRLAGHDGGPLLTDEQHERLDELARSLDEENIDPE